MTTAVHNVERVWRVCSQKNQERKLKIWHKKGFSNSIGRHVIPCALHAKLNSEGDLKSETKSYYQTHQSQQINYSKSSAKIVRQNKRTFSF